MNTTKRNKLAILQETASDTIETSKFTSPISNINSAFTGEIIKALTTSGSITLNSSQGPTMDKEPPLSPNKWSS